MGAAPAWARIGWRNLGRNPRRTILTACGLAVGYFAVVFVVGWTDGLNEELIENATSLAGGQIQIHDHDYLPDRSIYDTVGGRMGVDVPGLLAVVDADPAVLSSSPRVHAAGLVSSGETTIALSLLGVNIGRELQVSRFLNPLDRGRLPRPGTQELLVGSETARQLAVDVGEELVLVAPGADGSLANDLFTLAGTFRTGLPDLDNGLVVLPIRDLQRFVGLPETRVHEVAIATENPREADATARRLEAALVGLAPGIAAAPWTELHPVVVDYVGLADRMHWIMSAIVFTVAIFGIANTMLVATFEREREFAVMLALGAAPRSIASTVVTESFAIGFASLAVGALVTVPVMVWWHLAPPSLDWLYGNTTIGGVLITPNLRVAFDLTTWFWAAAALLFTTVLAAVYPALRAASIAPADTLCGP